VSHLYFYLLPNYKNCFIRAAVKSAVLSVFAKHSEALLMKPISAGTAGNVFGMMIDTHLLQ
jgi:hypothetical protein